MLLFLVGYAQDAKAAMPSWDECARVSASAFGSVTTPLGWTAESLRAARLAVQAGNRRLHYVLYEALAALALGAPVAEAETLVGLVLDKQLGAAAGAMSGYFPWAEDETAVRDKNSVDFVGYALGVIFKRYGGCFSLDLRTRANAAFRLTVAALARDAARVNVGYTNIWLMNSLALVLLGEMTGDAAAADQGYKQLQEFRALVSRDGITEFDSPAYYGVDIPLLLAARPLLQTASGRDQLDRLLDHFAIDVAANLLRSRGTLSGPHSRDYDFLRGAGNLYDVPFVALGLRPVPSKTIKADLLHALYFQGALDAPYVLPEAARSLLDLPERVVTQAWRQPKVPSNLGQERYNYITRDFAIGSVSSTYGPQDKLITVDLSGPNDLPTLSVVPTASNKARGIPDDPYGRSRRKDSSGHDKATHLRFHPVSAQHKGMLLSLVSSDPPTDLPDDITTSVIIPIPEASGRIEADGKSVVIDKTQTKSATGQTIPLEVGATVAIWQRHTGVAIRIVSAEGCDGQKPSVFLRFDSVGFPLKAGRLGVTHFRAPGRQSASVADCRARVALLIAAARAENETEFKALVESIRAATVDETFIPSNSRRGWQWRADARVTSGPYGSVALAAERRDDWDDKRRYVRSISREVNGRPMAFGILEINGVEYASRLDRSVSVSTSR